jgi:hypothetical protein
MTLATVSSPLRAIVSANSQYVIAGGDTSHGIILTSTNQTDWTPVYSNSVGSINALAFDGARFQAVGNGRIVSSVDGMNWTATYIGGTTLASIACGNGISLALGYGPGAVQVTLRSTDGTTWVPVPPAPVATPAGCPVAFGNNLFVAVGVPAGGGSGICSTRDGSAWALPNNPGYTPSAIIYASGMFVAGGGGDVLLSPDGTNWTKDTWACRRANCVRYTRIR